MDESFNMRKAERLSAFGLLLLSVALPYLIEHLSGNATAAIIAFLCCLLAGVVLMVLASRRVKTAAEHISLLGASIPATDPQPDQSLSDADPCVDIELLENRDGSLNETTFFLCNNGGSVARNIQLQPIDLICGRLVFESVGSISKGAKQGLRPHLDGVGILPAFDVIPLFNREWDAVGRSTGTIPEELMIPVAIQYQNHRGAPFETTADLVFFGIKEHMQRSPGRIFEYDPVTSVRNVRSTKLPRISAVEELARLELSQKPGAPGSRRAFRR